VVWGIFFPDILLVKTVLPHLAIDKEIGEAMQVKISHHPQKFSASVIFFYFELMY